MVEGQEESVADAVRRDTGALNIIETSSILLNGFALLLLRGDDIAACRMLYSLDGITVQVKTDSHRSDRRQAACSHTTRAYRALVLARHE
jgi:hypothetical protein